MSRRLPNETYEFQKTSPKPCQITAFLEGSGRKQLIQAAFGLSITPDNDTYLAYTAMQHTTNKTSVKSSERSSFCTLFFLLSTSQDSPGQGMSERKVHTSLFARI